MNFKKWTTALMLALAVSSCIQDEALNSEAAIDACTARMYNWLTSTVTLKK